MLYLIILIVSLAVFFLLEYFSYKDSLYKFVKNGLGIPASEKIVLKKKRVELQYRYKFLPPDFCLVYDGLKDEKFRLMLSQRMVKSLGKLSEGDKYTEKGYSLISGELFRYYIVEETLSGKIHYVGTELLMNLPVKLYVRKVGN